MSATAEHMRAIGEKGRAVRDARGGRRRALAAGECGLTDALEDPACATLPIENVLCWLPYHGSWRARQILARANVSPTRPVGGLTARERTAILCETPA